MDIWNNKAALQTKIKRFTLKATASAVLALNAEAAMADNCSTEIYGNTLAGVICDFNLASGSSVTVESGGTVGGILMTAAYQPTDSFIKVDAGGQVSNTTAVGIAINSTSSLSNGLVNSGSISAQTGIGIKTNSVISGGISNSGSISSVQTGISIFSSVISNGLSNNGTISTTSGLGISIVHGNTINGGIFNSGVINAHATGLLIKRYSTINGDIFNSGTISSSNHGTGIFIQDSMINGSIFNSGTISGAGDDSGISIRTNSIVNGITNQGLINTVSGNAIHLLHSSVIHGGILNQGRIESSAGNGMYIGYSSIMDGSITNKEIIDGGQKGIAIRSSSTVGEVVNSGTIHGGSTGIALSSSAINGGVLNSGTIRGGSTGVKLSFTSTVNGGISNSGTIQGDIFAISVINNTATTVDILGQKARVIGAVNAESTDVNITNGASFTSEGSYDVNTFNIAQNALFNMANAVTVATGFNNSGTLIVNDSSQVITGNYTQNTGGVFQTDVSSANSYGQLLVTGVADLSQSGNVNVQINQNSSINAGDVLSNVVSGSTFTSPTDGFNVTDNSLIWTAIAGLNNDDTGVNLTFTIDPKAYTACQGLYCQGAADAIIGQVADGNALFSPYATLSTASALQTAASQATPELTNENIQVIQLITRAVADIVPMWDGLRGRSSGDAMLYQPGKVWVKPYGASMTQNKRTSVDGFDATAYGAVVGKDIELSNHWLFGGALAAGGDNIHGKSVLSGQSIHSNAYQGMLYGSKKLPKQFYVAGQGLVGYEANNTSRAIPLYASTAKGSYNSWFTNLRAEAGWSTYAFGPNLVFTPEIDASYLFINQGSYQESGSPMRLSVAANNNSSLVLGAYGNAAYHLATFKNQQNLTVTAYAGVAGDVINSQPQVTSTFVAAGSSFSTFGVQFNGAVFRGGAGLMLSSPTKPLMVELNYDLQVGNNAYSGVGAATIKYKL